MLKAFCGFNDPCQSQVRDWAQVTPEDLFILPFLFYSQGRALKVLTYFCVSGPLFWSPYLNPYWWCPELPPQLFNHHASFSSFWVVYTDLPRKARSPGLSLRYLCVGVCIVPVCVPMHPCMWNPEVKIRYSPLSFRNLFMSSFSELRLSVPTAMHSFLCGWWGSRLRILHLGVSILPTEPSSHPYKTY